ncbi:16S rRNA (guanine(966)-N(2))-methyltransferase RsmD [Paenactinomyces guangxiensis]|uniref:16S rRNA (Guanine(966)-N(2))-methyltransferase RsmD n=1 Tax=Paenactinomyces guangxiensis TaxID=1490290 RepID=A0A7W2A7N6_9BACL|nr:16S rRNA (guanine(966)-N(2))-methyltransferase RsmD [Paenactinomyces guangxiensis]MBA4494746.1 16S rRNA (guanine(966)-N(2))-methyltransferase RsmD [Paenactinomyces guangxiensis]MBH8591830.1 16S rRNA (guanine(966)-N(2))-methyltransferase RsmD [Paenactinomyces guangxiensis]
MRIIAGTARGTRLKMVPGSHVRPTADRVKESLFQVIGPFFDGGWVLDLFAGTGALGLEALSRGAERAIFIDRSKTSLDTIRSNVEAARMNDRAEIYRRDARSVLKVLKQRKLRFRIIFLDPPYQGNLLLPVLEQISKNDLLNEDGVVVAEYPTRRELPPSIGTLIATRQLSYGDTSIFLYQSGLSKEGRQ